MHLNFVPKLVTFLMPPLKLFLDRAWVCLFLSKNGPSPCPWHRCERGKNTKSSTYPARKKRKGFFEYESKIRIGSAGHTPFYSEQHLTIEEVLFWIRGSSLFPKFLKWGVLAWTQGPPNSNDVSLPAPGLLFICLFIQIYIQNKKTEYLRCCRKK